MMLVLTFMPNIIQAQYYGNCTYHAYRDCIGNNVYWYSSCGIVQDIYTNCFGGQTCQYGQCTTYIQPIVPPINNYVVQSRIACYNNSLYWYDSLGVVSGLYKSCADNNSCTVDACSNNKCINTIKCDGSTCNSESFDYKTNCAPLATPIPTNTVVPTPLITANNGLSLSFFVKQDQNSSQWQKNAQIGQNAPVYFMISVLNNSTAQVDNVNISANIPIEVSSLGNLQLNGVQVSGDIITGINIGSVSPSTTKLITFEGKTQQISVASAQSAVVTTNIAGGLSQSDSVSLNFNPTQVSSAVDATAAVAKSSASSGFWEFWKHWYLWIVAAVILVFIFIAVFKRFSSDV